MKKAFTVIIILCAALSAQARNPHKKYDFLECKWNDGKIPASIVEDEPPVNFAAGWDCVMTRDIVVATPLTVNWPSHVFDGRGHIIYGGDNCPKYLFMVTSERAGLFASLNLFASKRCDGTKYYGIEYYDTPSNKGHGICCGKRPPKDLPK